MSQAEAQSDVAERMYISSWSRPDFVARFQKELESTRSEFFSENGVLRKNMLKEGMASLPPHLLATFLAGYHNAYTEPMPDGSPEWYAVPPRVRKKLGPPGKKDKRLTKEARVESPFATSTLEIPLDKHPVVSYAQDWANFNRIWNDLPHIPHRIRGLPLQLELCGSLSDTPGFRSASTLEAFCSGGVFSLVHSRAQHVAAQHIGGRSEKRARSLLEKQLDSEAFRHTQLDHEAFGIPWPFSSAKAEDGGAKQKEVLDKAIKGGDASWMTKLTSWFTCSGEKCQPSVDHLAGMYRTNMHCEEHTTEATSCNKTCNKFGPEYTSVVALAPWNFDAVNGEVDTPMLVDYPPLQKLEEGAVVKLLDPDSNVRADDPLELPMARTKEETFYGLCGQAVRSAFRKHEPVGENAGYIANMANLPVDTGRNSTKWQAAMKRVHKLWVHSKKGSHNLWTCFIGHGECTHNLWTCFIGAEDVGLGSSTRSDE